MDLEDYNTLDEETYDDNRDEQEYQPEAKFYERSAFEQYKIDYKNKETNLQSRLTVIFGSYPILSKYKTAVFEFVDKVSYPYYLNPIGLILGFHLVQTKSDSSKSLASTLTETMAFGNTFLKAEMTRYKVKKPDVYRYYKFISSRL